MMRFLNNNPIYPLLSSVLSTWTEPEIFGIKSLGGSKVSIKRPVCSRLLELEKKNTGHLKYPDQEV